MQQKRFASALVRVMFGSNKAYILYDGIISILLLATTMVFFNQTFNINAKLNHKANIQGELISALYYKIDNPDSTEFKGVKIEDADKEICALKADEKICINK